MCLTSVSCNKISSGNVQGGTDIAFSASVDGSENETVTKSYYAGDKYTSGGKLFEHIYWTQGDIVRIYCPEVKEPSTKYADYKITSVNNDSKYIANIELSPSQTTGLRWNDEATDPNHTFYGVFPSPSAEGISKSISAGTIEGELATNQNTLSGALSSNDGNYVLAPDMKWQLMAATPKQFSRQTFPETGKVFLEFSPITTAIQFTITNEGDNDLVLKQISLLSNGTQIAGKFNIADISVKEGNFPKVTGSDATKKAVSLDFSSTVTIAKNKTFTFTFFLTPVSDVADLYFQVKRVTDGSEVTMKTRLGYSDGTYLSFSRCKKSFVTGIMVPDGVVWNMDTFNVSHVEWEYDYTFNPSFE